MHPFRDAIIGLHAAIAAPRRVLVREPQLTWRCIRAQCERAAARAAASGEVLAEHLGRLRGMPSRAMRLVEAYAREPPVLVTAFNFC